MVSFVLFLVLVQGVVAPKMRLRKFDECELIYRGHSLSDFSGGFRDYEAWGQSHLHGPRLKVSFLTKIILQVYFLSKMLCRKVVPYISMLKQRINKSIGCIQMLYCVLCIFFF